MIIREGMQSLELTVRERGPAGTQSEGDVCFDIAVVSTGFAGRNDSVWIQGADWTRFIADFAKLEKTRRGEAVLQAASPNDFHLKIFAADRAGHMRAEGWVGREYAGRGGERGSRVVFHLEIDPTTLPILAGEFAGISST